MSSTTVKKETDLPGHQSAIQIQR